METFGGILYGFSITLTWSNLFYCFAGTCSSGRWSGCLPGLGTGGRHVPSLPGDAAYSSRFRHHHAGRNLLRGDVRRLHHFHPGQHPRRSCLGHHLHRRLPDGPRAGGPAWPWGSAPWGPSSAGPWRWWPSSWWPLPWPKSPWPLVFPEYFSLMCCGLVVLTFMARGSMVKASDDGGRGDLPGNHRDRPDHGDSPVHLRNSNLHGRVWASSP